MMIEKQNNDNNAKPKHEEEKQATENYLIQTSKRKNNGALMLA